MKDSENKDSTIKDSTIKDSENKDSKIKDNENKDSKMKNSENKDSKIKIHTGLPCRFRRQSNTRIKTAQVLIDTDAGFKTSSSD